MNHEDARGAHFVQSLERGLAVIRAFSADEDSMTLSEVARKTGLTRAAARRFLLTLSDLGYVRTDGRQFELTPRVLELGYAYLSSAGLPEVAQPHLERLVAEVRESSSVSVLDGDEVVIDSPEAAEGLALRRSMITDGISPDAVTVYKEDESAGAARFWEASLSGA
jgi:DNA-binding IclR family transcriptional regulator